MQSCLTPQQLSELWGDDLDVSERQTRESHLGDCPACQRTLLSLSGDSSEWERWQALLPTEQLPAVTGEQPPQEFLDQLRESTAEGKLSIEVLSAAAGPNESWPQIPGYQILGELGRGGTAVVYQARQVSLKRFVALKVILAHSFAAADRLNRFRAEAESVAQLQHPNIVQVYETGEHQGLPYFALEFVGGGNLAQLTRGRPQPPIDAAALIETLARAMHYAHQQGIIHRDLKPSNILLKIVEGGGWRVEGGERLSPSTLHPLPSTIPKIADFGLALHVDDDASLTRTGDVLGTPSYMAPEQAQGRREDVGPATDIHALGTLLFELLTGRPPFVAATSVDTLLLVSFEEPVPPRRLQPTLARDLETICLKCLRKLPRQRYGSALELAEDLRRFLAGEPIHARPITAAERSVKWVKRRPLVATLLAGIVGVSLAAFLAVSLALVQTSAARRDEASHRQAAEEARAQTQKALEKSEQSVYFGNIAQARSQWQLNNIGASEQLLERCPTDRRGWEWQFLRSLNHSDLRTIADGSGPFVNGLAYSPDGRWLAAGGGSPFGGGEYGMLRVFDAATGSKVWENAAHRFHINAISISSNSRFLASGGGPWFGPGVSEVKLWDLATGRLVHDLVGHKAPVASAAFSPDAKVLASLSADGKLLQWSVATGKRLDEWGLDEIGGRIVFHPSGRHLAVSTQFAIHIFDTASGKRLRRLPSQEGLLAYSPDGKHLAVGGARVKVFDVSDIEREVPLPLVQTIGGSNSNLLNMDFHPDGLSLATAWSDGVVRCWDLYSGAERGVYRGHLGRVASLAYHPNGRTLASGGQQPGEIKAWDLTRPGEYVEAVSYGRDRLDVDAICFSEDNKSLLAVSKHGLFRRWDVETGRLGQERYHNGSGEWLVPAAPAAFSGDGRTLALVDDDDSTKIFVVDAPTGKRKAELAGHGAKVWFVALDRPGSLLISAALGQRDGHPFREVKVWDVATGRLVREDATVDERSRWVALSPDGLRMAEIWRGVEVGPDGQRRFGPGEIRVSNVNPKNTAGAELSLSGFPGSLQCLAFSQDGRLLAAADDTGAVRIWDSRLGEPLHDRPLQGPPGLQALVFHPGGTRLAGASRERVQVWDVASGQDLLFLRGADTRPTDNGFNPVLAWSPDGMRVAVSNWNRVVSVWNAADCDDDAGKKDLARLANSRAFEWHLMWSETVDSPATRFARDFHENRLMELEPNSPTEWRARANHFLRRGDLRLARRDFATAIALDLKGSPRDFILYGILLLYLGEDEAFAALRSRALSEVNDDDDPVMKRALVSICGLGPLSPEDAAVVLRLAEQARKARPKNHPQIFGEGLAQFRSGRWEEAERSLLPLTETKNEIADFQARAAVVLALAYARQNRMDEAKRLLAKADRWLTDAMPTAALFLKGKADYDWNGTIWLEIAVLRKEAAGILPPPKAPEKPSN